MEELVGKPSETDSIKPQISSKTSRGKKDRTGGGGGAGGGGSAGSWCLRAGGHNAKITYKTNRHNRNETSQAKINEIQLRGDKTEEPPWDSQRCNH